MRVSRRFMLRLQEGAAKDMSVHPHRRFDMARLPVYILVAACCIRHWLVAVSVSAVSHLELLQDASTDT